MEQGQCKRKAWKAWRWLWQDLFIILIRKSLHLQWKLHYYRSFQSWWPLTYLHSAPYGNGCFRSPVDSMIENYKNNPLTIIHLINSVKKMINFLLMSFERWDIGGLQGGLVSTVKMSGLKLSTCVSLAEECMPPINYTFCQLHSF